MLAETRETAVHGKGWLFELKYDGYRLLAAREERRGAALASGAARTRPRASPRSRAPSRGLPYDGARARRRGRGPRRAGAPQLRAPPEARAAAARLRHRARRVELPATLFVFDLLALRGLRPAAAAARGAQGAAARACCRAPGRCATADHIEEQGEAFYERCARSGSRASWRKRADAPYRGGPLAALAEAARSTATSDFVIVGLSPPRGDAHRLRRAAPGGVRGRRASSTRAASAPGSARRTCGAIRERSSRLRRADAAPATATCPKGAGHVWVEPRARLRGALQGVDRRAGCCGSRCSCACATTRRPRSACASGADGRAEPRASRSRAAAGARASSRRSPSRTSTRSSGPRRATRRAT